MKKILLIAAVLFLLAGCGSKNKEELGEVELKGVPEEKVTSSITVGGFTIDIYVTYASVTGYTGTDTNISIPESAAGVRIKTISENAFKGNDKIKKVTLPSTMLIIDRYAFENCSALETVILNDGLETIADYAFRNSAVAVCDLTDSIGSLGKYSFYGCKKLSGTVHIPANLYRGMKYTFYGCEKLTDIEFSPRFSEIGENMFYNCTGLTKITIPETVKKICNYAFSGCTGLTEIEIPAETETVSEGVFFGCSNLTVYTPEGSAAYKACVKNKWKVEPIKAED